ncbi:MAG: hypothetical protein KBC67_00005, partial [Candidatus Pacebacteria bacterium]|nr:hypothetical protein [Candidatus Paceibacterota bacterium]
MVQRYAWLRYILIVLAVAVVGFSAAFFVDRKTNLGTYFGWHKTLTGNGIDASGIQTGSNASTNSTSLITPILNKLGQVLGIRLSLTATGEEWGIVEGLTMFRGSPTRTFYGLGPLPADPKVLWRYPNSTSLNGDKPMCSYSEAEGVTKQWCGTGWTGQPVVWERPDGITEVIFGAYDGAVHFLNAKTGQETRPSFQTGDLIKGSVTLDPDGFPLLYFGSRDNKLRILSLDTKNEDGTPATPVEVWSLNANEVKGKWNNDWDGNPVVINDMLFEGGENGWFFVIKLNRSYREDVSGEKKVSVTPQIVFKMPGWNDELLKNIGDDMVSIESSVTFYGDRVYFINSGGRVVGLDISDVKDGVAPIVFDYWVGDDADATMVVDEKGMLYVSVELERTKEPAATRSAELGQFIKLDPTKQNIDKKTGAVLGDPYVWGIHIPKETFSKGGIWATPALSGNYFYIPTHTGKLLTV